MPNLLETGAASFSEGNYGQAATSFGKVRSSYSGEPEWQDGQLPRKLLPLEGFAALKAQLWDQSISAFELFLDNYADNYSQEAFAAYALASAYQQAGDTDKAIAQYAHYRSIAKSPSQQGIAALQEAMLRRNTGEGEKASALLHGILDSEAAPRVKTQARLAAIRGAMESEEANKAAHLLLQHHWQTNSMPELAILSFLAIEAGDHFLSEGNASQALRAYQLALPKDALLSRQRNKLAELEARYLSRRQQIGIAATLWDDFYASILHALRSQLSALEAADDYSEALMLRKGQAYLHTGRPKEAWMAFESIARAPDSPLASKAHLLWISAARQSGLVDEAIAIAEAHLTRYPGSPDAAQALYQMGIAFMDKRRFAASITLWSRILEMDASSLLAPGALFQRAYCKAQLKRYAEAESDFRALKETYPQSMLRPNASIWIGLCLFFQGNYEDAASFFAQMQSDFSEASIQAEALYRQATCQYALGRYAPTLRSVARFLQGYPNHARESEIRALSGDAHFAQGEYEKAIVAYSWIPFEQAELHFHALLQSVQARLMLGRVDEALTQLASYCDGPLPTRLFSPAWEALINALLIQGFPERAEQAWTTAMSRAFELKPSPNTLTLVEALSTQPNYGRLLEEQIELAQATARANSLALLQVARAQHLARSDQPHQSEALLLEVAGAYSIEALPEEALALCGLQLVGIHSPQGRDMLDALLRSYPNSNYLGYAYFGFAKAHAAQNEPLLAVAWLDRLSSDDYALPIYAEALLLKGASLAQSKQYQLAAAAHESLLALPWAKTREKGSALLGLARVKELQEKPKQAIAYYQRLFTLYAAFESLAAEGYRGSAELFLALEQYESAYQTCSEFLGQERFAQYEFQDRMKGIMETAIQQIEARAAAVKGADA